MEKKKPTPASPTQYRNALRINRADLDDCVAEQPELFDHVAEAHVLAIAERDAIKLDIEEAEAEEDQQVRADAAKAEEKITEAEIKRVLQLNPRIKEMQRAYLKAKIAVDSWGALKESYRDRSYMLRELVALFLARVSARGSVTAAQGRMADSNRELAGEERSRR